MELLEQDETASIEGVLQTPNQRRREFMNLSAALDYASWVQPIALSISKEGSVWVMNYIGGNE